MSSPHLKDIATALALLSRLPVQAKFDRTAQASWAYPLVGTVVAILGALAAGISMIFGVSAPMAAGIYLAVTIVVTGAMHEDGLADVADGFWGGWERDQRLAIMKDSQIGTYGTLALILGLIARWAALWLLIESDAWVFALIAIETLSRAFMPVLMHLLPNARTEGLSQSQGRPSRHTAALGLSIAALLSLLALGLTALPMILLGGLATFGMMQLAKAKIGGQTGDVLGATQQITAIIMLAWIA